MKDKLLSTICLCRRAGKLVWGFDSVAETMKESKATMVLLAQDISPKSAKEVRFLAEKNNIKVVNAPLTMEEIWRRLGKRAGILAVTDKGLAQTLQTAITRMNEEE